MCGTPRTFQTEYFQVPDDLDHHPLLFTLILPPDSLNSGKNPSQTDSPSGHRLSVNGRPPVTSACLAIRDSHRSTSTYEFSKERHPTSIHLGLSILMDFNAGAEPMEHSMFVRRGMG